MWVPRSPAYVCWRRFSGRTRGRLAKAYRLSATDRFGRSAANLLTRQESPTPYAPRVPGALVTGAGRGMGLEIARRLVGRGYEVAVTDVDQALTSSAAEQLGDRAWPLRLDVTKAEAVDAAASEVIRRSGSLDVWVNNAGILIT